MRKIFLSIVFNFLSLLSFAQQISLEYGKVFSSFDYTNSNGEKLQNMHGSVNNHLALGINLPLKKSDFYFLSGMALNSYGAQFSDEVLGNYFDWKVNYLDVNIGCGYEFFKSNSMINFKNTNSESAFTLYTQFYTGAEFLMQGTQTNNRQVYDLKGEEQFKKPLLLLQGGLGLKYYASKSILVYLQYMGGKSFSVFKPESGDNEKLNFITHTISLGIGMVLPVHR
jgi:hypothetical protein